MRRDRLDQPLRMRRFSEGACSNGGQGWGWVAVGRRDGEWTLVGLGCGRGEQGETVPHLEAKALLKGMQYVGLFAKGHEGDAIAMCLQEHGGVSGTHPRRAFPLEEEITLAMIRERW